MPDRHKTYRLTLTPATEAELLRLKECGENKQLLSRCALWCSSDALEALIVLRKWRYPYQVGQAGEWGECRLTSKSAPWMAALPVSQPSVLRMAGTPRSQPYTPTRWLRSRRASHP